MCVSMFSSLVALVGGGFANAGSSGLWCLAFGNTSTAALDFIGARLLNLIKGSDVQNASLLRFTLLSAVLGPTFYVVGFGVVIFVMTLHWRTSVAELDHLYCCGT